jgi:Na+(H+)/acetate symporter ActP
VLVFVFFIFQPTPMLFNPVYDEAVAASPRAGEYQALGQEYAQARDARQQAATAFAAAQADATQTATMAAARAEFEAQSAAVDGVRARARTLISEVTGDDDYRDVNYVFPTFVTEYMPIGLVGLFIAAIFAAAMSSIAAELNSLSTATVIDFYRRHFRKTASDAHYLKVSRYATIFWGAFACTFAVFAANAGSLIEVVNRYGSYFYGSILGVFILAIGFRRATGTGAFVGLIGGMTTVAWFATYTDVAFLWLNIVGAVSVTVVGMLVSLFTPPEAAGS